MFVFDTPAFGLVDCSRVSERSEKKGCFPCNTAFLAFWPFLAFVLHASTVWEIPDETWEPFITSFEPKSFI